MEIVETRGWEKVGRGTVGWRQISFWGRLLTGGIRCNAWGQAGLSVHKGQSNLQWKHRIWIRPSPHLPWLLFSPLSLSLLSFFFWASGSCVLSYLHIFSDRKDKQRLGPEGMRVAWRPEHTSLCIQGFAPQISFNPFTTCMGERLFYLLLIHRWFTGKASTKGQKIRVTKITCCYGRNYTGSFVFSSSSPFRQSD